ncbi:radical SAM protein [Larkinella sp. GY13]|uniref:radical SAM protein n=1 Tax=Larkinella sp. GY13 TaxID=3453720 RepID=UPI003EEDD05D
MDNSLSLIIKSTRKCNLRCSYCHDWRSRGTVISFEILANIVAKAFRAKRYKVINFIWHGGEPLLLGIDFFRRALSLQQAFIQEGQYVLNSVQINGTLLTEEWCDFFRKNHFQVGVSVDGPEEIHNRNRSFASGKGSFQQVIKSIDLLKEYGIGHGVLLVLNENTKRLPAPEIFDFITRDLKVDNFSFLPAVPDNLIGQNSGERATTDYLSLEDYEEFMIRIFDHWYALDNPDIRVREIDGIVRSVMRGNPQVCTLAGNCLGGYYHIEPEGDVYHCDKYVGDPMYNLGNILESDFDSLFKSPQMRALRRQERDNLQRLSACQHYGICNGGCPHDRYIAKKYRTDFTGECCGQNRLISHIIRALGQDIGAEKMAVFGHTV